MIGGQPGINALSATFYPTYLRSTGVGAGLGVGRTGAIIGPYLGGVLLAQQWTPQQLFWVAAVPAAVSTAVILALRIVMRAPAPSASAAPVAHYGVLSGLRWWCDLASPSWCDWPSLVQSHDTRKTRSQRPTSVRLHRQA